MPIPLSRERASRGFENGKFDGGPTVSLFLGKLRGDCGAFLSLDKSEKQVKVA
jgi:hypothetical protein